MFPLKTVSRLTGVHVCSVRQRLGLPPITDSFLLLLLQDEPAQVGLDLRVNAVSRCTASVLSGLQMLVCVAPTFSSSCSCSVLASSVRSSNSSSSSSLFFFHSISARIHSQAHSVTCFCKVGAWYIECLLCSAPSFVKKKWKCTSVQSDHFPLCK